MTTELTVQEAITQFQDATTLEQLSKLDDLFNEADTELQVVGTDEYRQAFDAAERSLIMTEVPEQPVAEILPALPQTVEELGALVLELRAKLEALGTAGHGRKPANVQVRAGVSYKILRTTGAETYTQNQARVILGLICNWAVENKRDEITEAEVAEIVDSARARGFLGGHQPPMRVFRYYMSESTLGFKARGFLQKVGG